MVVGLANSYKSPDSPLLGGPLTSTKSKTIHVIAEGEIVGLVDGAKTLYLNDTPLQNANGSNNFNGVSFEDRVGLDNQDKIPGFSGIATEVSVGVSVRPENPPTVRTVTNPDIDRVVLKIAYSYNASGFFSFGYRIHMNINGVQVAQRDVGRTVSTTESFDIDLRGFTAPYNISVNISGPISFGSDQVYFVSYTEFIDSAIRYSGTAIVGLSIDSALFGSQLPTASFLIKGKKIQIPTNYNPESRTYTGIWDGNFKVDFCNNPAWVLYDLLTNDTYGMGRLTSGYNITPNKYDLYNCAVYNDEMISDGMGGTEPRYQYNGVIIGGERPYDLINKVLSSFRANMYVSGNIIYFTQDRPGDVVKIVNKSNVIDGKFTYSSAEFAGIFSAVVVTYNNPQSQYRQDQVVVEDMDLILSMGYKTMDIVAEGCTSQAQAYRFGNWYLDSQKNSGQLVTYEASLDHIDVRPNDIIALYDDFIGGPDLSGRILGFDGSRLFNLDRPIEMESGKNYKFMFISDNGVLNTKDIVRSHIDEDESVTSITINEDFSLDVSKYALFLVKSINYIEPRLFRITSISGTDNPIIFKVNATEYDPTKYNRIESDIFVDQSPDSLLEKFATTIPKDVKIDVSFSIVNRVPINTITLSWNVLLQATQYEIQYLNPFELQWNQKIVQNNNLIITGSDGDYHFLIRGIDSFGEKSRWVEFKYTVRTSHIQITDVSNFNASRDGSVIIFSWDRIDSAILDFYEIRRGTDWKTAHVITTTTNTQFIFSDPKADTYMIKACSFTGGYSSSEGIIQVQAGDKENVVYTRDEAALEWPGTLTNLVKGDDNKLYMLDTPAYYTNGIIDLGKILTVRPSASIDFDAVENSTIDEFAEAYPLIGNIPDHLRLGDNPDGVSVKFQISYSQDNILYSDFVDYSGGFYTARYFKFKMSLTQNYLTVFPVVNNMVMSIDSQNIVEVRKDLTVSSSGLTLTYDKTYNEIPAISVSILGGSPGDNVQVTKNITQATFAIYDKDGIQKSGTIDVTINGY